MPKVDGKSDLHTRLAAVRFDSIVDIANRYARFLATIFFSVLLAPHEFSARRTARK